MAPNNHPKPLSDAEWEKAKPLFEHLYIGEGRTLPQVMTLMESRHGFKASPKMYKNRIKAWGFSKYLKADEAERILNQTGASEEDQRAAQRSMIRRRTREAGKHKHGRHLSNASETTPPLQPVQQHPLPTRPPTLDVTPPTIQPYQHQHQHQHQQHQPQQHQHQQQALPPQQQRHHSIQSPITSNSFVTEPSPMQTDAPPAPWSHTHQPPQPQPQPPFHRASTSTSTVIDQFLINLRRWTHEAFVSRHWERSASSQHTKGRHASRLLASDLQAGIKFLEQSNQELAWVHWRRAVAHFQNRELFKTWYHETPVRLLFEVSRIHHSGLHDFAATLLRMVSDWADQFLDSSDSRHALYKLYGKIPVDALRDLHERSAICMLEGLETRLDKNAPLLFEIRLNRALDMIWFDPTADLGRWLPRLEEVDRACGEGNVFSVYYLLLEAYSLVAREEFEEAERVAREAAVRIERVMQVAKEAREEGGGEGKDGGGEDAGPVVDEWRLGMAYRRLGRMQYQKGRYQDARRSFNTALRYVGMGGRQADSIMVEVFQCQESMAVKTGDREDAELWRQMLRSYERKIKENEEAEAFREAARGTGVAVVPVVSVNGGGIGTGEVAMGGMNSPVLAGHNGGDGGAVNGDTVESPTPLIRRETA